MGVSLPAGGAPTRAGGAPASRVAHTSLAIVRLLPLLVAVYVLGVWVRTIVRSADRLETMRLDWYAYWLAARRFVAGDFAAIYPPAELVNVWMYPPYALWASTPLALLSEPVAYAVCAATAFVGGLVAAELVGAATGAPRDRRLAATALVAASMPFTMSVILGQASGPLAMILAAALLAWRRGADFVAGVLLALFMAKPNLGYVIPLLCLVARRRRVLTGFALGSSVLLASTLVLGFELWRFYYDGSRAFVDYIETTVPMWKQATLYAFWRTMPPFSRWSLAQVKLLWIASIVVLVGVTVRVWWLRWRDVAPPVPRLVGLAVLLTIAANPYAYYYDSLLLLVPGVTVYLDGVSYRARRSRLVALVCAGSILVLGYVTVLVVKGGVAWTGALASVWLLAEAYDLRRGAGAAA
jgi:hypothetical protein